jgi:hypothetical protein
VTVTVTPGSDLVGLVEGDHLDHGIGHLRASGRSEAMARREAAIGSWHPRGEHLASVWQPGARPAVGGAGAIGTPSAE